ncbi:hypothetical protein [Pinisolibacter sp.]|uniref:hypothetical protein n=1 Tax=Pinisolibacter sp. TaxID=2172024 RepID=UPI002FDEF29D
MIAFTCRSLSFATTFGMSATHHPTHHQFAHYSGWLRTTIDIQPAKSAENSQLIGRQNSMVNVSLVVLGSTNSLPKSRGFPRILFSGADFSRYSSSVVGG